MNFFIVGQTGNFGRLLRDELAKQGHSIVGCGSKDFQQKKSLTSDADVVIFAVPLHKMEQVTADLTPFSHDNQLWIDIGSLKLKSIKSMLQSKAKVIGTHPLFAPNTGFHNQNVIICPARDTSDKKYEKVVMDLFVTMGAKITTMQADEHDRIMGVVQQLPHFVLIAWGLTLKELAIDPNKLQATSTPVFRLMKEALDKMSTQDPSIYHAIQKENLLTAENIALFNKNIGLLQTAIKQSDDKEFTKLLKSLS